MPTMRSSLPSQRKRNEAAPNSLQTETPPDFVGFVGFQQAGERFGAVQIGCALSYVQKLQAQATAIGSLAIRERVVGKDGKNGD